MHLSDPQRLAATAKTVFLIYTQFVGTFTIHTKLHMLSFNGSLVNSTKLKSEDRFRKAEMLFHIKISLINAAYVLVICYHVSPCNMLQLQATLKK